MQELETYLSEIAQLTEKKLEELLAGDDKDYCVLQQAMRYSACGGGKRIRPFLCVAVCEMLGGDPQKALTVAAALEMVHTYSLIHDDLPCMDNDDLRRGRPTCHVRYGEATALLAGDALLTLAFEVIAAEPTLTHEQRVTAVSVLARAAGHNGMIAGQVMDLAAEDKEDVSLAELKKLQQLKTGAMIRAAVRLGAVAADKSDGDLLQADGTIITYGTTAAVALQAKEMLAAKGFRCGICLLEQLTPCTAVAEQIAAALPGRGRIVFLEEGIYEGGAAMCLGAELASLVPDFVRRYIPLAIRRPFATPECLCDLRAFHGISAGDVVSAFLTDDTEQG